MQGLRVVFSPRLASLAAYSYRVPQPETRGTVTAVRLSGELRTYISGPGGGLVYVELDTDGLVCGVSLRDLKLELAKDVR